MIEPDGQVVLWNVPRLWPGQTIVCAASGPSLTQEQMKQAMESDCRVITINDSYKLSPLADILYACDARWWIWHKLVGGFLGVRIGLAWDGVAGKIYPQWNSENMINNIHLLASTGDAGLETEDSRGLRTGGNSGYQAINLAVHLGAKRIVLLGYDMKPDDGKHHWFGSHPYDVPAPPYEKFLELFATLVDPLKELEVEVVNCTPDSALDVFPVTGNQ